MTLQSNESNDTLASLQHNIVESESESKVIETLVFNEPDSSENCIFDDSNNFKAGTFAKIIERLTHPRIRDSNFLYDFVLTYRSVATSFQVLDALILRYDTAPPEDAKVIWLHILNVLKHWIEKCWYDFAKDSPELSSQCLDFLDRCIVNLAIRTVASSVKAKLLRKIQGQSTNLTKSAETSPPPLFSTKDANLPLIELNSEEIARQLTIIEWSIWANIQPWECLDLSWTKKNKEEKAPNVLALIERFNVVSSWVSTAICMQENLKKRIKHIQKFIDIAVFLKNMGNFNAVMEIVSGLNRSPVYRLRQTWEILPSPLRKSFDELLEIVDRSKSYANMRRVLRQANPPCIPYLGMYLTDLIFIEEGNKDMIGGLINWNKRHQISETIRAIKQYQQKRYMFTNVPAIRKLLMNVTVLDEETLYELSEWIEPRTGKERGPKPALLQNASSSITSSISSASLSSSNSFGNLLTGSGVGSILSSMPIELELIDDYPFSIPDVPSNIVLDLNTNSIKAGTLPKIIERLTHHVAPDSNSLFSFIDTFGSFSNPKEVLQLLISRFNIPPPKDKSPAMMERYKQEIQLPISLRVFNTFKTWIDRRFYHFEDDQELRSQLEEFIKGDFAQQQPRFAQTLQNAILKQSQIRRSFTNVNYIPSLESTGPITPRPLSSLSSPIPLSPSPSPTASIASTAPINFFELINEQVAQQLCLIHYGLFALVRSEDIIRICFSTVPETKNNTNVDAFTNSFSHTVFWVQEELKRIDQCGSSIPILIKWLDICKHTILLNNFFAARAIFYVLEDYQRLIPGIIDLLPPASSNLFLEIRGLLRPNGHQTLSSPCVPFIQEYFTLLSEIHLKHGPSTIDNKINFEKYHASGEIIETLSRLQRSPYPFEAIPHIQQYIQGFKLDEDNIENNRIKIIASAPTMNKSIFQSSSSPSYKMDSRPTAISTPTSISTSNTGDTSFNSSSLGTSQVFTEPLYIHATLSGSPSSVKENGTHLIIEPQVQSKLNQLVNQHIGRHELLFQSQASLYILDEKQDDLDLNFMIHSQANYIKSSPEYPPINNNTIVNDSSILASNMKSNQSEYDRYGRSSLFNSFSNIDPSPSPPSQSYLTSPLQSNNVSEVSHFEHLSIKSHPIVPNCPLPTTPVQSSGISTRQDDYIHRWNDHEKGQKGLMAASTPSVLLQNTSIRTASSSKPVTNFLKNQYQSSCKGLSTKISSQTDAGNHNLSGNSSIQQNPYQSSAPLDSPHSISSPFNQQKAEQDLRHSPSPQNNQPEPSPNYPFHSFAQIANPISPSHASFLDLEKRLIEKEKRETLTANRRREDAAAAASLDQVAKSVLQLQFPRAIEVIEEIQNPATGNKVSVRVMKQENRSFLYEVRPAFELEDVVTLLKLGKAYKNQKPSESLACIIVTSNITSDALEKASLFKIRVYQV